MAESGGTPKLETYMVIHEVEILEDGDHKGDLLITVEAVRNGKEYKRPYMIAAAQIAKIDMDMLKQRVNVDIDELENQASMQSAVVENLKAQKGKQIDLAK